MLFDGGYFCKIIQSQLCWFVGKVFFFCLTDSIRTDLLSQKILSLSSFRILPLSSLFILVFLRQQMDKNTRKSRIIKVINLFNVLLINRVK